MFWRRPRATAPAHAIPPEESPTAVVPTPSASGPRILVPCESFVLRGGLLRFERFGRALRQFGGALAYLPLAPDGQGAWRSAFPALSLDEAAARRWDATMIPGAGFGPAAMRRLGAFRDPVFGVRVQHVLNDMKRPDGFFEVDRVFAPDLVIFNNRHWTAEMQARFSCPRRAVLEGAVDLEALAPTPFRRPPGADGTVTIGGLANKNFGAVLRALALLPERFQAQAIGTPSAELEAAAATFAPGRVRLLGPMPESALPAFFATVDVVAHVERRAGWANIAAEALACGTPLIATRAGTLAFAEHERTALVLDEPEPEAIARAVLRIADDPALAISLARAGRETIAALGWNAYARSLLDLTFGSAGGA